MIILFPQKKCRAIHKTCMNKGTQLGLNHGVGTWVRLLSPHQTEATVLEGHEESGTNGEEAKATQGMSGVFVFTWGRGNIIAPRHAQRQVLGLRGSVPGSGEPRILDSPYLFCSDMRSRAPLCDSRHVHTQMTCWLECQPKKLCFPWLVPDTS